MKKKTTAAAAALVLAFMLSLSGCQAQAAQADKPAETPAPAPKWGITLSAKDVTPTGLTLVITQSGGEPTGELQYGTPYSIDVLKDGAWEKAPYAVDEETEGMIGWTMEAYLLPMGTSVEENINWEFLYGSLPAGTYRISKSFTDFREAGNYDKETFYAEFEIK